MISLHYTSHTKAYNTIYTACNIMEAIYSFTEFISDDICYVGGMQPAEWLRERNASERGQSQPTWHLLAGIHRHALWTVTATASHWL